MSKRIALLGLSGVGKSTFVARLQEIKSVLHLQASALIKSEQLILSKQPSSSEALRTGPVLDNQVLMIKAFNREAALTELPIVFDGHSVIDGGNGLVEIPSSVFAALQLDSVCFLSAHPNLILQRRLADKERKRPKRDLETLNMHQTAAKKAAERIAFDIQCPFFLFKEGDINRAVVLLD